MFSSVLPNKVHGAVEFVGDVSWVDVPGGFDRCGMDVNCDLKCSMHWVFVFPGDVQGSDVWK